MRICTTTPAAARDLVLRELARGPRTLPELCRWALSHTDCRKILPAGALLDTMVADGVVTRGLEPFGRKMGLKMTYRLATKD